ncbi:MAG: hypothetical protein LBR80_11495 [Deltaproteobacteria bacterium]|jgi:hypothetical protein|nr:hypothetical protein [Deltaproteobacteria bacterium]
MSARKNVDIGDLILSDGPIIEAFRQAGIATMRDHIQAGLPMISWHDGKIVKIPPEKLAKMLEDDDYSPFEESSQ